MQYGLGHLSVVPIRETADPMARMVSQVLYGDVFKIKEERKYFSRIQLVFDGFEGWIKNDQINKISEEDFLNITTSSKEACFNADFLSYVTTQDNELLPVVMGSRLDLCFLLKHRCDELVGMNTQWKKSNLVETALLYLNSPFLSGGKTPFGIDSSGFTQMVYKINGKKLLRTTQEQSKQGEALSFIEESEPGDLAFFDDAEGTINHVGIILKDNHIIHASGHVRIDRLDHTGIFNTDSRNYSHSLRVIKKVI
ncbi:MAG: C40 family peptidase [Bacteroidota bacterium]